MTDLTLEQSAARKTAEISDIDIQALIDGELSPVRTKIVQRALERDSSARQRYRELEEQKKILQDWWQQFS